MTSSSDTFQPAISPFGATVSRRQVLTMSMATAGAFALGTYGQALAQEGEAVRGGTLRGAVVGPITSLDPFTSKLSSGDSITYRFLYNSLLEISSTGELMPEIASSWTISEDGLTYTFTLVEGVTFHDGTVLDAEAIKWNLERYKQEGSSYASADRLRVIAEIDATDPATLVITLSTPNTPFLTNVGAVPIVSPTAAEAMGEDFQLKAVGSGPFTSVSWEPGSTATFERYESYWEVAPDGEPFPYLDEVVIEGVPDDSVRLLNLQSGQFEVNERINPRDVAAISADPNIQIIETAHATPYIVALNPTKAPFDNKALRQAVQFGLDRQAIIDNISFGTGYTIPIAFIKDSWFYIDEPSPVYDPEQAKALLAEAGYPDGIDVTFTIINRPTDNLIAQIAKAQMDAIGIRTTIEVLERTTWVDLWTAREGEMGILQGGMNPIDPDGQSGWWSDTSLANYAGYDNPEIRELISQANQTTDQAERLALWKEVTALNVDDAVYTFIGAIPTTMAARKNVKDLVTVGGFYWEVRDIWLEQ
jgi:ABC-type transport system substrate-binding protein